MKKEYLKQIFAEELLNIYSGKLGIVKAIPVVIEAVESPELKELFIVHQKEGQEQIDRLNKIFKIINITKKQTKSIAIDALLQECMEVIENYPQSALRDAAIISRAQRIAHYEISIFGTLRTFAKELGSDSTVVNLLQTSLNEEARMDKKLSKVAEGGFILSGINRKANREG